MPSQPSALDISGLGVALVTPFNDDCSVDYESLKRILHHLEDSGCVDYLVVLATTSEAVTLTHDERHKVARFVAENYKGRKILGMSNNCTMELVEHLPEVDLSGYDAILSVVPYYNKPSQEGIYLHFAAVAKASPLPVVLYNVPSRTGRNMAASTTLRLAHDFPGRIIGIKEASGDMDQIAEIIAGKPEGFTVLSGDDALTLDMIAMGARGVISVIANAYPYEFGTLVHRALANPANEKSARIQQQLAPIYADLFRECNPSGIKALMHILGFCRNIVRLPLTPLTPHCYATLASHVKRLATATFNCE